MLIRAHYGVDVTKLSKVCGQPFTVTEIVDRAKACLADRDLRNTKTVEVNQV
jgi:hypothetical protein